MFIKELRIALEEHSYRSQGTVQLGDTTTKHNPYNISNKAFTHNTI